MRWLLAVAMALSVCCSTLDLASAGLLVNGYSAATAGHYDRFANDPNFVGSAFNWSGVGRTTAGRWGVLISPSFMVSAAHFPPGLGETVRFYSSNDPNGAFEERSIGSNVLMTQVGINVRSDLVLTRLSAPVTGISTFAIGNPSSNLIGEELFVWGQADNPNTFLNMRLGRNEVTDVIPGYADASLVGSGDVFLYDYNTKSGLGPDEAKLVTFDSGGPTFMVNDAGNLALVGVHWFTYNPDPMVPGSLGGSGDTLVTSFIDELNAAMAATGSSERVTVAAVPEPGALCLAIPGLGFVCLRRRGRVA